MATTTQNIELMQMRIDTMEKRLESIEGKLDNLTKKILDPDEGFVTRVNKNTSFRKDREELMPYFDELIDDFRIVRKWKDNVTKALWIIFTGLIGVIIKLIFFM